MKKKTVLLLCLVLCVLVLSACSLRPGTTMRQLKAACEQAANDEKMYRAQ